MLKNNFFRVWDETLQVIVRGKQARNILSKLLLACVYKMYLNHKWISHLESGHIPK